MTLNFNSNHVGVEHVVRLGGLCSFHILIHINFFGYLKNQIFKKCPHPDENKRRQINTELGLNLNQVKFWFQNKKTRLMVVFFFSILHF